MAPPQHYMFRGKGLLEWSAYEYDIGVVVKKVPKKPHTPRAKPHLEIGVVYTACTPA